MTQTVNLLTALDGVTEHWSPKVVGRVNDQYVKVAKVHGQLAWHKHDDEDELFQVVRGRLRIQGVVQIRVTPKTRNPLTVRALSISGVTWKWHFLNHARAPRPPRCGMTPKGWWIPTWGAAGSSSRRATPTQWVPCT